MCIFLLIANLQNINTSSNLNTSSSSNPSSSSYSNSSSDPSSSSYQGSSSTTAKVKSFSEYRKLKGTEWNKKVKGKEKDKAHDVIIFIGLLQWRHLDHKLKPARGKRIALRVSNQSPYAEIRFQALSKWKAYQSNIYEEEKEYSLVYEDGTKALFLPGTKEFFTLKRYKEETGKDYKRIVLYLCTDDDVAKCESFADNSDDDSVEEWSEQYQKRAKLQIINDEQVAMDLQSEFNNEFDNSKNTWSDDDFPPPVGSETERQDDESDSSSCKTQNEPASTLDRPEIQKNDSSNDVQDEPTSTHDEAIYKSTSEVVEKLEALVDHSNQFFIVIRRGSTLQRKLMIWQRQVAKDQSPKQRLMVSFAGEMGIDSGALAKEFFTSTISEIGKRIFPNGSPVNSMLNVHNGVFFTCGQIVATSIAQGGPGACFLEECVYDMLADEDVDMKTLSEEKHLTPHEQTLIVSIREDPKALEDTIMEHGYTGVIDTHHVEDIVGTVIISIISKRLLYLKEFRNGLNLYDLPAFLTSNANACKDLFVIGKSKEVDANFVVSCMKPCYSETGSSRRAVEELLVDNFQDLLISLEDESVTGYTEALAWDDGTDSIGNHEDDTAEREVLQSADLTPAGVFGWITGQKHVPLNGEKIEMILNFDHECMIRNENHSICFPVVGACGKTITLPVAHMRESEHFKKVFLLGYCNGQATVRR